MFTYRLAVEKIGQNYSYKTPDFPDIEGVGPTENDAVVELFKKVECSLNQKIAAGESLPESCEDLKAAEPKKGTGSFQMPFGSELKMQLHTEMLNQGVTLEMLAGMSATKKEATTETAASTLNRIKSLLDLSQDSTLNEISELFRVLNCSLNVSVIDKAA